MPVVEPIAIPLATLLVFALLFALAYTASVTIQWVGNELGHLLHFLPFGAGKRAGKAVSGWGVHAAQYFGGLAGKADARVAAAWHSLAAVVEQIGHGIEDAAAATYRLGQYMHGVVRPAVIHATLGKLTHAQKVANAAAAGAQADINHDRNAINHPATSPIGGYVATKVKPIGLEIDHLTNIVNAYTHALPLPQAHALPGEVADLRARAKSVTERLGNLWDHVRGIGKSVTWPLAAGLVVTAIGRLGGGWLFCRNWRSIGKAGCRLDPSTLESLLAGALTIAGTISIIEFAKELQGVVGEGADALHHFIREG